jgi:hypothetical protein
MIQLPENMKINIVNKNNAEQIHFFRPYFGFNNFRENLTSKIRNIKFHLFFFFLLLPANKTRTENLR